MSTSPHKRLKGCCGVCGHIPDNSKANQHPKLMRHMGKVRRFSKRVDVDD